MEEKNKTIFAFISYNHKDVRWAKWLRRRLEWYKLPSQTANGFDNSKYIRPVFRDRDELNAGILNDSLLSKLGDSRFLIVVCSRNSAKSRWVSDEIQAFIDMGRAEYIIPFIIEDGFDDIDECLPEALRKWNRDNPQKTILGISVYDDNVSSKPKALIRLVSRLLQLDFDVLWRRHKREMAAMVAWTSFVSCVILFLLYWFGIPVHMFLNISSPDSALPELRSGVVSVCDKELTVNKPDTLVDFGTVPGSFRLRSVPVRFTADRFYVPYESTVKVSPGLKSSFSISLQRDSSFGIFAGTVIDEQGSAVIGAVVIIGNKTVQTDSFGRFSISFPLEEQSVVKPVCVSGDGFNPYERNDECPSDNLVYLLHSE